jgi:hypothetical protein
VRGSIGGVATCMRWAGGRSERAEAIFPQARLAFSAAEPG